MKYVLLLICLQLSPVFADEKFGDEKLADEKLANEKYASEKLWDIYDSILITHLTPSSRQGIDVNLVDYAGLRKDPTFAALVEALSTYPVSTLKSKSEKLAFYINAYNILTIQLILEHNPASSIKEIGGFFSGPWDQTVLKNELGKLTLDDIEHQIIRPLGDPRIHFAVNCASLSCPDLRMEAYRSDLLDVQLDDQTRHFVSQKGKGVFIRGKSVFVSKLFSWYKKDFDLRGGVVAFIGEYYAETKGKELEFLDYNWSLNKLEFSD